MLNLFVHLRAWAHNNFFLFQYDIGYHDIVT